MRRDWLVIVFVTNCVDSHTQQCTHAHTPGHGHTRDTFRSRSHALLSDRHTTLLHIHCPRGPLSPFFSLEFPRQRYRVTHTSTRACHTVLPRVFTTSTLVRVTRSLSRPMHKSLAPPSFPPPLSDAPRPHTPTTPSLSVILHRYPPSATFPSRRPSRLFIFLLLLFRRSHARRDTPLLFFFFFSILYSLLLFFIHLLSPYYIIYYTTNYDYMISI